MLSPVFLTVEQVIELHRQGIDRYGGSHGLRDRGMLESAVSAPTHTWGGTYLHSSLEEMAASYWFSLASNHPFIDGNKRVALLACLNFLGQNGLWLVATNAELENATLRIAAHEMTKEEVTAFVMDRVAAA